MSTYLEAPVQTERRPLSIASTLARLALIGVALAVVAGAFANLGGWLTPNNLTPARLTDAETVEAMNVIKGQPLASGFDNSTFHGLNAFRLVDSTGASVPVRWVLTPMQPFEAASTASSVQPKNYLFDALIAKIHQQPLRWQLILVIGQPGDPTHDATIAWPAGRERVDVGTLTLDRVDAEDTSAATDINFDPLVLPAGIAPSDDPLLSARSAVYSQSFTRREGEAKQPSAITPADVRRGD